MAAAGIHGAGEALRGTVNSVVDRRLGADQEAMKKNEAAIQVGRYEIENRRFHGRHDDMTNSHSDAVEAPEIKTYSALPAAQQDGRSSSNIGESFSQRVSKSRFGDRLGNFAKVLGERSEESGREDAYEPEMAPARRPAKLQKRSNSMLSVVGE